VPSDPSGLAAWIAARSTATLDPRATGP